MDESAMEYGCFRNEKIDGLERENVRKSESDYVRQF